MVGHIWRLVKSEGRTLMRTRIVTLIPVILLLGCFASAQEPRSAHKFGIDGDHFVLDGKPFQIISGEMHYARIPREY